MICHRKSHVATVVLFTAALAAAPAVRAQGHEQHHPPEPAKAQEGMMGQPQMTGVERCFPGMMSGGMMGGMQEGPGMMGHMGMMGQMGMMRGMMGGGMGVRGAAMDPGLHIGCLREALDLTDAQVQQLRKLRDQHHQNVQSFADQIEDVSAQLEPLMSADRPDVAKIRPLLEKRAALHAQMQAAHLEVHAKSYDVLTPEQREKVKAARERMRMRGMEMMRERMPRGEMERP